jgi:hypothetical protein
VLCIFVLHNWTASDLNTILYFMLTTKILDFYPRNKSHITRYHSCVVYHKCALYHSHCDWYRFTKLFVKECINLCDSILLICILFFMAYILIKMSFPN